MNVTHATASNLLYLASFRQEPEQEIRQSAWNGYITIKVNIADSLKIFLSIKWQLLKYADDDCMTMPKLTGLTEFW